MNLVSQSTQVGHFVEESSKGIRNVGKQVKTASQTFEFYMNRLKIGLSVLWIKRVELSKFKFSNYVKKKRVNKILVFYRRFFCKNLPCTWPKTLMLYDKRKLLLKILWQNSSTFQSSLVLALSLLLPLLKDIINFCWSLVPYPRTSQRRFQIPSTNFQSESYG